MNKEPKPVEIHLDPYEGKVILAKRGLLGFGWCCAPKAMPIEEVQRRVHIECEPYIDVRGLGSLHDNEANDDTITPWTVVRREHDDPEWQSPGRCADDEHRQHWFMIGGLSGAFMIAMTEGNAETAGIDPETKLQSFEDWQKANAS